MWLYSLKVAQLLRSAACLHTNQSRSYLNYLVHGAYFKSSVFFCCLFIPFNLSLKLIIVLWTYFVDVILFAFVRGTFFVG